MSCWSLVNIFDDAVQLLLICRAMILAVFGHLPFVHLSFSERPGAGHY